MTDSPDAQPENEERGGGEDVAEDVLDVLRESPPGEIRAEALLEAVRQDNATYVALRRQVTQIEPYTDADDIAKLRLGAPEAYDEVLKDMRQTRELSRLEVEARLAIARDAQQLERDVALDAVAGDNAGRRRGQFIAGTFAGGCLVIAGIGAVDRSAAVVAASLSVSVVSGIGALAASWYRRDG